MNWKSISVISLIIALLFWIPFTRVAILFILPLGSGVDDLIFLSFLVIGIVAFTVRHLEIALDKTRALFLGIVGVALLVIFLFIFLGG